MPKYDLPAVSNSMIRGEGIPVPGRWYPSRQQVLHWVPTEDVLVPLNRRRNTQLCDGRSPRFPEARLAHARFCDRCLYYVRKAIAMKRAGVEFDKPEPPATEEMVRVKVEVLIAPSEYAVHVAGGDTVKAGRDVVVGLLEKSESLKHLKVHEAKPAVVPRAERTIEV